MFSKTGLHVIGSRTKESKMITGKANHIGEEMLLAKAEAVPLAPLILISEEQPAIRELLCWIVQLAGYRAMAFSGRQAALVWREQARWPGDQVVGLLLDLSLLSPYEAEDLLCHLRARWREASAVLPHIIILTTDPRVQEHLRPNEYVLLKPFHNQEIITLLQQAATVCSHSENASSREEPTPAQ